MHARVTPPWKLLPLLAILALAGAGCVKTNPTGWTPEDIAALPEAHLVPPGTKASSPSLEDGKDRVTEDTPTNVSFGVGFDQPYDDVISFYEDQLVPLGWTRSFASRSTRENYATAWTKDGLRLRIGVNAHRDSKPAGELVGFAHSASIVISAYGKKEK